MATHKVYVVGQDYQAADASAAAASAAPAGRGGRGGSPAVADSFKVLVFGMSK
jgi:hypothetical protein